MISFEPFKIFEQPFFQSSLITQTKESDESKTDWLKQGWEAPRKSIFGFRFDKSLELVYEPEFISASLYIFLSGRERVHSL